LATGPAQHGSATETLADGQYRHPSPKHLLLERIGGLIGLLILGFIGGSAVTALWFFGPLEGLYRFIPFTAFLLVLSWSAFGGLYWPMVSHRYRRYRLDEESIEIQTGVLWRSSVSVPCSRVQHADVAQGPLERRLGLATLTLHTAGTEHASVSLAGVEYERALALRDHLVGAADRITA
jgi:membrane protein YdbS with pleckstrin-like domain